MIGLIIHYGIRFTNTYARPARKDGIAKDIRRKMRLKSYINEQIDVKAKILKKLDQWKKDLRRMTKLYRSLKAENTPQAVKKFEEAKKYFITFRQNWEKWVNQELLISKSGKDETYWREQLRISGWQAEMSINSLFPHSYNYQTGKDEPAPWLLDSQRYSKGDTRKNRILIYQKKFKKAFDAIEDLANQEADDINLLKDREQHTIAGINVLITGKRYEKQEKREKDLEMFLKVLPEAVSRIKKSGLDLSLKGLTIEIALAGAKAVGVKSGAGGSYDYVNDWLRMYPWGMLGKMDALRTFIHELGHRYYYKNLTERVRNAWDSAIRRRQVEIKDENIDDFFGLYVGDIDNERFNKKATIAKIKKTEKNPSLARIYIHLVHNFPRWYVENEDKKTNYIRKMKEFYSGEWIDLEFVTDYAATKPNEAFAEVFSYWVVKRNKLGEWTRAFFKEIVRSGGANIRESKIENIKLSALDKMTPLERAKLVFPDADKKDLSKIVKRIEKLLQEK